MANTTDAVPSPKDAMYLKLLLDVQGLLLPSSSHAPSTDPATASPSRTTSALPAVAPLLPTIPTLANISSAIFHELNRFYNAAAPLGELTINWVGFYLLTTPSLLTLGPFQGKVACTEIRLGKGVCSHAVLQGKAVVVEDVHAFPGHIACDSESASEIVIPIFSEAQNQRIVGVLDIDSTQKATFGEGDAAMLGKLCKMIGEAVAFAPRDVGSSASGHPTATRSGQRPFASAVPFPASIAENMKTLEHKQWRFHSIKGLRMLPASHYHDLATALKVEALPEIIYPDTILRFSHLPSHLVFTINARDALACCASYYHSPHYAAANSAGCLQVASAKQWADKVAAHSLHDPNIDWAFRNDYRGTWTRRPPPPQQQQQESTKSEVAAELSVPLEPVGASSTLKIPMDRLKRQDIPILQFDSVELFEDELHDSGTSRMVVKYRVMDDFAFVLLRHFIRVDNVIVIVQDTRIFVDLLETQEAPLILVECSKREMQLPPMVAPEAGGPSPSASGAPSPSAKYKDPDAFLHEMSEVEHCSYVVRVKSQ